MFGGFGGFECLGFGVGLFMGLGVWVFVLFGGFGCMVGWGVVFCSWYGCVI